MGEDSEAAVEARQSMDMPACVAIINVHGYIAHWSADLHLYACNHKTGDKIFSDPPAGLAAFQNIVSVLESRRHQERGDAP